MVQFPTSGYVHLCVQCTLIRFYPNRVTPFGNPRITVCVSLPAAFRNLLRPSSPDSPKASTMNSYSLDHIYRYTLNIFSRFLLHVDFCVSPPHGSPHAKASLPLLLSILRYACQRTRLPTYAAITLAIQPDSLAFAG